MAAIADVVENKRLQAETLGSLHTVETMGKRSGAYPNLEGWTDDEMANIVFAHMLKYRPPNNVVVTFSKRNPDGTVIILVNRDTDEQRYFAYDVPRAKERVDSICEKTQVLVNKRNVALYDTGRIDVKDALWEVETSLGNIPTHKEE